MNFSNTQKFKNNNLLLAVADESAFKLPLKLELENIGFRVFLFNYRKNNNLERFISLLSIIFPQLKKKIIHLRNHRLLNTIKKNNIAVLFVSKGESILPETINKIKEMQVITINWYTDWFHDLKNYQKILLPYDLVFTADNSDVYFNQNKFNVYHLPYGGFNNGKKINFLRRKYDVVFIGAWSLEREELLFSLRNFKLFIWGNSLWKKTKVKSYYQGDWLNPEQVIDILSQSKIVINQSQYQADIHTTVNLRVFEATANGALVITDFRKDLPDLFKLNNNKEVVLFSSERELKSLVEFYLKNSDIRIKIARRGYGRTINNYNYAKRIKYILSLVSKA